MTTIIWDQIGERKYQTGIDRGVLYSGDDNIGVPWNGLTSVEETPDKEAKPYYQDGIRYYDSQVAGDYQGKIKAFTYPQELDRLIGVMDTPIDGLYIHDQISLRFGLSYRTLIGNDVEGTNHGYTIHIVYNVLAIPDSISYLTLNDSPTPFEFSWTTQALPEIPTEALLGRPSAHYTFDSTKMVPDILVALEGILYGSEESDPTLPSIDSLTSLLGE